MRVASAFGFFSQVSANGNAHAAKYEQVSSAIDTRVICLFDYEYEPSRCKVMQAQQVGFIVLIVWAVIASRLLMCCLNEALRHALAIGLVLL